jgi:hypothetical protein
MEKILRDLAVLNGAAEFNLLRSADVVKDLKGSGEETERNA